MLIRESEMSFGEQAALEGLLAMTRPRIAVEVGTYRGGSLRRIARHAEQVHTFDLVRHTSAVLPNVCYHLGDSRLVLPEVLGRIAACDAYVDFALVDGDHARNGVRQDAIALLESPAVRRSVIVFHDVANEEVRQGIQDAVRGRLDLAYVDLSFTVPSTTSSLLGEAWGGLGIVIVDRAGDLWPYAPDVRPNVHWRTTTVRSLPWRALAKPRATKRAVAYGLRPTLRRMGAARGVLDSDAD